MEQISSDRPKRWLVFAAAIMAGFQVFIWVFTVLAVGLAAVSAAALFSTSADPTLVTILVVLIAGVGGGAVSFFVGRLVQRRLARAALVTVAIWASVLAILTFLAAPMPFVYTIY